MLGVRRGYIRGVGLKLKGTTSTSSTIASLPRAPPMLDSKLEYLNKLMCYMSNALARLVLGFHMSIQPFAVPDILPMPLPPTLPPLRFQPKPSPLTSDTQDNADQDESDLGS
ncbi:hypothetical protein PanWU01x14_093140 [Parasponia andersonii]|uniref:Uncharacterized protein n=1 Tax=Parasponia andersonii TaxID=3476 RepID=A0A2P5D600_PARAD|nr:hypothetical protein PanWU01x14_093140 [Parasponia andersonii]